MENKKLGGGDSQADPGLVLYPEREVQSAEAGMGILIKNSITEEILWVS
jgi:hypothetical protein